MFEKCQESVGSRLSGMHLSGKALAPERQAAVFDREYSNDVAGVGPICKLADATLIYEQVVTDR